MKQKTKREMTVFCMSVMFLFAVSCTLIGNLLPEVINEFQISLSKAGTVTVAQNFGGILALALCGLLADRLGKLRVIAVIFLMMVLALCFCFGIQSFRSFILVAAVIGLASSSLNMLVSAYLSDLYPARSYFYINMGGVFFGIGSVAAPVYFAAAQSWQLNWRSVFGLMGILGAAVTVIFLIFSGRALGQKQDGSGAMGALRPGETVQILRRPQMVFLALIGFFYMAHSSSFMAWIPTYLSEKFPEQGTMNQSIMTVYWIGILASRVIMMAFSEKVQPRKYLLWGSLAGGAVMVACAFLRGIPLMAGFGALGVITGAIFQTCLALTCQTFPRLSGTASAVVALSASLGGTLCCWLVGNAAERWGFFSAIVIQAAALFLIVPLMIGETKITKERK